jgi:hypothetical protein
MGCKGIKTDPNGQNRCENRFLGSWGPFPDDNRRQFWARKAPSLYFYAACRDLKADGLSFASFFC